MTEGQRHLQVSVVTLDRELFEGTDVTKVIVPASEGELTVLPRHQPLMTMLRSGELGIVRESGAEWFAVHSGFLQVRPDRVVIMADIAEPAEEIVEARAEAARLRAEQAWRQARKREDVQEALASLRRATVRLKVVRRRK